MKAYVKPVEPVDVDIIMEMSRGEAMTLYNSIQQLVGTNIMCPGMPLTTLSAHLHTILTNT